jgi:hypothetical protein
MKSTNPNGSLKILKECYLIIMGSTINMNILPDISDSKSASYADENGIGRTMPFKTYNNSENRTISWTAHFFACNSSDIDQMLKILRLIESATYPRTGNTGGAPYAPPEVCKLKCGSLLGDDPVCAVMKSYSVKFDTSVPWDEVLSIPHKMDIDMQFDVIYDQSNLPGAEKIMISGY